MAVSAAAPPLSGFLFPRAARCRPFARCFRSRSRAFSTCFRPSSLSGSSACPFYCPSPRRTSLSTAPCVPRFLWPPLPLASLGPPRLTAQLSAHLPILSIYLFPLPPPPAVLRVPFHRTLGSSAPPRRSLSRKHPLLPPASRWLPRVGSPCTFAHLAFPPPFRPYFPFFRLVLRSFSSTLCLAVPVSCSDPFPSLSFFIFYLHSLPRSVGSGFPFS